MSPPADETPVTLYITPGDNQDIALSLTLIPKRIPAREIHLSLDKDSYKVLTKLQQQAKTASSAKAADQEQEYISPSKKNLPRSGSAKNASGVFPARSQSRREHPVPAKPGAD